MIQQEEAEVAEFVENPNLCFLCDLLFKKTISKRVVNH